MTRSRHTIEQKLSALRMMNQGTYTWKEIREAHDVSMDTLQLWKVKFDTGGIDALKQSRTWKPYTKEQKIAAVRDYLGGLTKLETLSKHQISHWSVLHRWIRKYTSHSELTDSRKGMGLAMTKGRKTTFEERFEIVKYCLENGRNYQQTAEQYQVSYAQVYGWVKKYDTTGAEALLDRRGRTKPEDELSEEEKLKRRIQQMELENELLRADNLFPKKVRGDREEVVISQVRLQQRYIAIKELNEEEALSIVLLCRVAGISRAAYYKWLNRTISVRQEENEKLLEDIRLLYDQANGTYGYRRITMTINRLRRQQSLSPFNEKRIYRLMHSHGIQSIIRRKRRKHKKSTPQHVAENLMNREFSAARPDEKWCTDVTEFKYGAGKKAYLSAIIDLYDGSIVAYRVGKSNNNGLVFKTMMPAIARLRTGASLMIHSDRGFQYTSRGFKRMVEDAGLTHSMSRVGRCIDNAPIESFWGTLKVEMYYLREFQAYSELTKAIENYIAFYNHDRFQKRLNGLSPVEYRSQAA
ncbi:MULTISPECIES: IS3 family transposase [Exiguobacterium]|uniref:IS3 family transposase n=1 Tax=Exiguobacterium TaxID=33986 RepID=UPI00110E7813|nr:MULTISPECIES: IS3 family transposase [Exiguobacterium]